MVIANEIFDAFPCELVYTSKENILQQAVINEHEIDFVKCEDEYLKNICANYKIVKGEVAIGYEKFAKNLASNIEKFEFITFDYGDKYPRNDFSIRVYDKHNVFPLFDEGVDLANFFGRCDITYDVNFLHLIDSFKIYKIVNISYQTQLKALIEFGIIELLEILRDNTSYEIYLKETQKVKILCEPTRMGERFKVAIFRKG